MKLGVYSYRTNKLLGRFLNVTADNKTIKIWYVNNEYVKSAFREDILIKEIPDHGPC